MNEIEKKLWKKVETYVPILRHVPFLSYVSVCNNLSFSNVKPDSDIDLFIIAKKNRLFLVRTLTTLLFQIYGVRRYGKKTIGRFCLSFFIDESHLNLSNIAITNDIYLAFWLKYQKPILDDGISNDLILANKWLKKYFDDTIEYDSSFLIDNKSFIKSITQVIFSGYLGDLLESLLRKWQLKRSRNKSSILSDISGIKISKNILKFHNLDRRREFRNKWYNKYSNSDKLELEKFKQL